MVRYKNLQFLGFPKYRVGTDGSVWSYRYVRNSSGRYAWKRLVCKRRDGDYVRVCLCNGRSKRMFLVHRLVLLAFVGSCPIGMEARHFPNRDRSDNRLVNLSWSTKYDNMADKITHGTSTKGRSQNVGTDNGLAKLTPAIVRRIRKEYAPKEVTYQMLADRYGVSFWTVMDVVRRRKWAHVK